MTTHPGLVQHSELSWWQRNKKRSLRVNFRLLLVAGRHDLLLLYTQMRLAIECVSLSPTHPSSCTFVHPLLRQLWTR